MTERERDRNAARRLAIIRHAQEVTGNVSKTCGTTGSPGRPTTSGSGATRRPGSRVSGTGPRSPTTTPHATKAEVVGKIIYLRRSYHFGPQKIAMYLRRYHDVVVSSSGVWRILRCLGMSRLPSSQRHRRHQDRWKRYEKLLP